MTYDNYHHLGIPNTEEREGEEYFDRFKMYHTNFDDNPYGIEWLRFIPGCTLPEIVQKYPHIAFKVDNLEEAIKGKEILIEPNSPTEGVMVAFILHKGAPVEFLEYDDSRFVKDFPILETERLKLRQIRSEEAEDVFRMRTDSKAVEYLDIPAPRTVRDAYDLINKVARNFMEQKFPNWAITLKEDKDDKMIGYGGYVSRQKENARAELGYLLAPEYWGKGYMSEAMDAILRYGFEQMELHSIEAVVHPGNRASIKLLERFNFAREAYFNENHFHEGQYNDTAIYSLLKRDFV